MRQQDMPLLILANAGNYREKRRFYALKDALLESFGALQGYDLQIIEDLCWNCDGAGCRRCVGGVWNRRRVYLLRFRLHGRIFHRPVPILPQDLRGEEPCEKIHGYIRHPQVDSHRAQAAAMRLLYRYDRKEWAKILRNRLLGWLRQRWLSIGYRWRRWRWHLPSIRKSKSPEIPF